MLSVYRKELKYVIGVQEFALLRPKLQGALQPDRNGNNFGYVVRSLYFDSIHDRDYYDTVDGLLKKAKIRLRTYGSTYHDGDPIKLELKQKEGTDSLKRSLMLRRQEAECMIAGDYSFLLDRQEDAAGVIRRKLLRGGYQPKVLLEYDREAYVYPAGDVRITFDSGTRATTSAWNLFDPNPPFTPAIPAATGVLEVKYSSILPGFIKALLRADHLASSNGKYIQARDFYSMR